MRRPILIASIFVVLVILLLVACVPKTESQTIVVTVEPTQEVINYCAQLNYSVFNTIWRCDYNNEICYVAFESDGGAAIECFGVNNEKD